MKKKLLSWALTFALLFGLAEKPPTVKKFPCTQVDAPFSVEAAREDVRYIRREAAHKIHAAAGCTGLVAGTLLLLGIGYGFYETVKAEREAKEASGD